MINTIRYSEIKPFSERTVIEPMPRRIIRIDPKDPWPIRHTRDRQFAKHCVRCGDAVEVYEVDWDADNRVRQGRSIVNAERHTLFGGIHCRFCFITMKHVFEEALKALDAKLHS